jgi:hypothetical protein
MILQIIVTEEAIKEYAAKNCSKEVLQRCVRQLIDKDIVT